MMYWLYNKYKQGQKSLAFFKIHDLFHLKVPTSVVEESSKEEACLTQTMATSLFKLKVQILFFLHILQCKRTLHVKFHTKINI